jgi:hypothetical protein
MSGRNRRAAGTREHPRTNTKKPPRRAASRSREGGRKRARTLVAHEQANRRKRGEGKDNLVHHGRGLALRLSLGKAEVNADIKADNEAASTSAAIERGRHAQAPQALFGSGTTRPAKGGDGTDPRNPPIPVMIDVSFCGTGRLRMGGMRPEADTTAQVAGAVGALPLTRTSKGAVLWAELPAGVDPADRRRELSCGGTMAHIMPKCA